MKVILARTAGFCMGVRRAMNIVLDQAQRGAVPVRTHGPLIHNPQVIEALEGRGVSALPKDGVVEPGDEKGTVVIRAHGISPREREELGAGGFDIVDATCPHVLRIHKLIARHVAEGDEVVIVGDEGHAEVEGLLGSAGGHGHVVSHEDEVDWLPDMRSVAVVSQTTQSHDRFDRIVARIRRRWPDCTVHRTICNSTKRRQEATVDMARRADAMIVVGGRNSANTVRLAELSAETGTPTYHIETSEDLDLEALRGARVVGMTAGASTPHWMITEVMERLAELSRSQWHPALRAMFRSLQFLLDTNLYLALGAVAMAMGCAALLGEGSLVRPLHAAVAALYVLAMYSMHVPLESEAARFCNPFRWRFHQRYGRALIGMGVVALAGALAGAAFMGVWAFLLILAASAAGVFYRLTVLPHPLVSVVRYRRVVDIPGSKDIFMGLAWAAVLSLPPILSPPIEISPGRIVALAVVFHFVFTLVCTRSVLFAVRDLQGDQMVGRETIPIVLGVKRTKTLLLALTGSAALLLVAATAGGALPPTGYLMLAALAHAWLYLYLYHRRVLTQGVVFEAVAGAGFLLVGVLALVGRSLFG